MTETSHRMETVATEPDESASPDSDTHPDVGAAPPGAASVDRRVRYCPTCHARYVKAASECVACAKPLVDTQPRDVALFRPAIDIPFVLAFALYVMGYGKLNGEAQSFGLIFLIVGFATLVTFRAISYAEWLGRR